MIRTNRLKARDVSSLKEGWHCDGAGLYLRVENGERYWLLRKTFEGKRRTIPLGKFPAMSLTQARDAAKTAAPKASASRVRFKDIVYDAIKRLESVRIWSDHVRQEWYAFAKAYLVNAFGNKTLDSITTPDVLAVVEPVWKSKPPTGKIFRARLEAIFSYAIQMKLYNGANPARWKGNMELLLPSVGKLHQIKHFDACRIEELPSVYAKIATGTKQESKLLMLCILTASRINEVIGAEWSEFDFEKNIWSNPRRKDKKPEPHRVPLSTAALELLKTVPKTGSLLFPSARFPGAIKYATVRKYFLDYNWGFTIHGFRSTFRDWGAENGENPVYMEKALCHATGNTVEMTYQRSDCLEQRRPIMEKWGEYCTSGL